MGKTKPVRLLFLLFCLYPNIALPCTLAPGCPSGFDYSNAIRLGKNCTGFTYRYYPGSDFCIETCGSCDTKNGYMLVSSTCNVEESYCPGITDDQSISLPGRIPSNVCSTFTAYTCEYSYCTSGKYGNPGAGIPCVSCPANSDSPDRTTSITGCICNTGYYGNIRDENSVCSKCPANSMVPVHRQGTSVTDCECYSGYYGVITSDSSVCTKCPANSTSTAGSQTIADCKCNKGYYKVGNTCERCPSIGNVYGTTETSGATSINQCYIPSNTSITDTIGTFNFVSVCNYE